QHGGRAIDAARPGLEFTDEAVVQACKGGLFRFGEVGRTKQPEERNRAGAHERELDLAEPTHKKGQRAARDAIGEDEVELLVLEQTIKNGAQCHSPVVFLSILLPLWIRKLSPMSRRASAPPRPWAR